MSNVRRLLGFVVLALLTLGYLASQYAAVFGDAERYARAIDVPQVKFLSLLLFVAALVSCAFPEKEEDQ